mmetsp:Transcript_13932/g.46521  ORF Transcript_13932/g.46521 Transcript_13932/m.46521 type:complete len:245 (-) Transcript_13932:184-918(-)
MSGGSSVCKSRDGAPSLGRLFARKTASKRAPQRKPPPSMSMSMADAEPSPSPSKAVWAPDGKKCTASETATARPSRARASAASGAFESAVKAARASFTVDLASATSLVFCSNVENGACKIHGSSGAAGKWRCVAAAPTTAKAAARWCAWPDSAAAVTASRRRPSSASIIARPPGSASVERSDASRHRRASNAEAAGHASPAKTAGRAPTAPDPPRTAIRKLLLVPKGLVPKGRPKVLDSSTSRR